MKCKAVTQKGKPCRNNAKPGSKYCGVHGGGSAHSPDKLECPRCGSGNVISVPLAYQRGVRSGSSGAFMSSRGHVGVGFGSPTVSADAKSVAPPNNETTGFEWGCLTVVVGLIAFVVWFVFMFISAIIAKVFSIDTSFSDNFVFGSLTVIFVSVGTTIVVFLYRIGWFAHDKETYERWENSFRCNRCGEVFEWYG